MQIFLNSSFSRNSSRSSKNSSSHNNNSQNKIGSKTGSKTGSLVLGALIVGLVGCQSGPFAKKQPVPEPRYIPNIVLGEAQVLTILPNKVPCNSALPMLCMVARQPSGAMFQIPYSWVEGFQHANGVQYQIEVRPKVDDNNQQMTGHWVLQRVLNQQVAN